MAAALTLDGIYESVIKETRDARRAYFGGLMKQILEYAHGNVAGEA